MNFRLHVWHTCCCWCNFIAAQKQNQIISNKIETTTTTNNNNNIINNYNYNYNQTSTTIDMKSQMVKYNEYLHYLRFGFPKKNKF